jgi:hypothetical protein
MTQDKPQAAQVHPVFWFSDGSIVLRAQEQLFRVHHSLLSRLSPFFATLGTAGNAPSNDAGDLISSTSRLALFICLFQCTSVTRYGHLTLKFYSNIYTMTCE